MDAFRRERDGGLYRFQIPAEGTVAFLRKSLQVDIRRVDEGQKLQPGLWQDRAVRDQHGF
jgi:hypothetical protein